jgi:putative flippase GtrA
MAVRKAINSFIEFFYFPFLRFIPLKTFKYAACGGTTVVIDFMVYWFCYHFIFLASPVDLDFHVFEPHTLAQTCAFLVSFPLGFVLNKFVVFTESDLRGRVQLFRYGLTVIGSFALSILFLKLFCEVFEWNATFSKILATAMVVIYSYFSQQYFSFRVKGETRVKS